MEIVIEKKGGIIIIKKLIRKKSNFLERNEVVKL